MRATGLGVVADLLSEAIWTLLGTELARCGFRAGKDAEPIGSEEIGAGSVEYQTEIDRRCTAGACCGPTGPYREISCALLTRVGARPAGAGQ